eukprot:scaffold174830_cov80-Attheya_sp.AAC.1
MKHSLPIMTTDSSDIQLPAPMTPMLQPMTQAQASTMSSPPTMHFAEAAPTPTKEEQIQAMTDTIMAALQAQVDAVIATAVHSSKINQAITHPDSSSDLKVSTDEIDNCMDSSDSTLQLLKDIVYDCIDDIDPPVTSDFAGDFLGIKAPSKLLEQDDALPSPSSPATENDDFPHFSCYMGTGTNIHLTLSPADLSKFFSQGCMYIGYWFLHRSQTFSSYYF